MYFKNKLALIVGILMAFTVSAQKVTLSGKIFDKSSKESLIGVTVYIESLEKGVVSNEYGYYSLTVPPGEYDVVYTYVGFTNIKEKLNLNTDISKDVFLSENAESLNEIVVEANGSKQINIKKPDLSVNKLSISTIKDVPVVLGEVDVIKALLQLPGVTSAGEAAAGFNVRGGATDQNLILLDEVTLFSSSHLFGLFSIFNPDAVKDLTLYKGGIPSRYGGRISSVLDIYQKDGNYNEYHATGGIGLLSSRLLVEGPIAKGKTSFLAGGRSSYAHLFLPLFDIQNEALFYDLNLKINHIINDNNKLYLSSYLGKDVFELDDVFLNTYGNRFVNVRWNHIFNNKLFSNASAIYSNYFYQLDLDFVGFEWNSGIDNFNFKYDLVSYADENTTLRFGTNQLYYIFNPGKIEPLVEGENFETEQLTKKYAIEGAYYAEAEIDLTKKLSFNVGARLSSFFRLGEDDISIYENDQPVQFNSATGIYSEADEIGSFSLSRGKVLSDFFNFEPRFSSAYQLNDSNSIKASYQRTVQYIHLISNTASPTPLDIWAPSGPFIDPQISDQFAVGYFKEFKDAVYSFSFESFYKTIDNRLNFINGADIIANENIERVLLSGEGRTYGAEFLLQKNKGRFKGWLAYTLSKAEERVLGRTPEEPGLNNGEWFNSNQDKTHDITLNASYKISDKWKFNAAFNYQTGIPASFPSSQFTVFNRTVFNFDGRNESRLPANHRLDISASYKPNPNSNRKIKGEWVFGIYNVYNRDNATSITFSENRTTLQSEATQLSIFGIVPSVSYNFKF